MKLLNIFLFMSIFLTGCATVEHVAEPVEPRLIERVEYIIKVPPSELLTLPPQVDNINVDTATQADIARWIIANEQRTRILENLIREIAIFFRDQQARLNEQARLQNEARGAIGNPAQIVTTP